MNKRRVRRRKNNRSDGDVAYVMRKDKISSPGFVPSSHNVELQTTVIVHHEDKTQRRGEVLVTLLRMATTHGLHSLSNTIFYNMLKRHRCFQSLFYLRRFIAILLVH